MAGVTSAGTAPRPEGWMGRAAARLGGDSAFSTPIRIPADLVRLVTSGFPLASVEALCRTTLSVEELHRLVIPKRTLAHRKARGEPLSPEESDRALRIARIAALADDVFADVGAATQWLRRPTRALDGRAPLDLLASEAGAAIVEDLLMRIAHGIAA
jgi:putative toxin-antitoxin system antitoxin component (TIGR02293 family)